MNILITSVGRRAYLIDYFKDVLKNTGKVYVSNSTELTTAFNHADGFVKTPLIYDKEYIPFLLAYCKRMKINIVISVFDIDLPILALNKTLFEKNDIKIIVSDYSFISICNDKWATYKYLSEKGFNVPKTYNSYEKIKQALKKDEVSFPVVIKPRFGMGSIGIRIAYDFEDLQFYYKDVNRKIESTYLIYESRQKNDRIIFQEFLKGQEYGVDIINDLKENYINSIIKKKIAMRSGETDVAMTEDNKEIKLFAEKLGTITHHIANLDTDWFLCEGKAYILEMNARFGGGYPFSHAAGVDLPKAIVSWVENKKVDSGILNAKEGVTCAKEIEIKVL